ncbi:PREDICTED: uncharacterized protein LOC108367427 [Rhagoletis zephyria]|uniref:uncharacterized protein LOC108367427 n=1 Tax=Rhagoletis zephyria TaxID=28612 RepID=UPI00081131F2|nr:PREDICTED: uncharacterized protein LOC108367427 [Rhagoletis zephyria]XP_017477523.1 PREDICTED: uncharacterized protein LOC108367427 [Rhagoletis zephyria]XP_017477524.1 PREDICTED: uncharacterized protein LOC108367427 [Rhagoletis zephyria]XP_017477525.1 PREDICTED: uncharacterized protein LOC108367427 [Rhagoletis zephyria]XP_017477526.1 PREDICTED: uncharacterized protein LOC108367427 [Rhagoletis zephyria]XP_017477527.1 PREDICTED: uncharacterized protein LOC108367427 [Rhagoletis zephyria]
MAKSLWDEGNNMHLATKQMSYTDKRATKFAGVEICQQTQVNNVLTTKQAKIAMQTKEQQLRMKAKMGESSTKICRVAQKTRIPTLLATNRAIVRISKQKVQNTHPNHDVKCLANRAACHACLSINATCCATFLYTIYNTISRIPWIFLLLSVLAFHICQSGVIAYKPAARTMELQRAIIDPHHRALRATQYSQLLSTDGQWAGNDNNNSFRPIIPKDISPEIIAQNVFTHTGQYRVFQPATSDLRIAVAMEQNAKNVVDFEANTGSMASMEAQTNTTTGSGMNNENKLGTKNPTTEQKTMAEAKVTKLMTQKKDGKQKEVAAPPMTTLGNTKWQSEYAEHSTQIRLSEKALDAHEGKALPFTSALSQLAAEQRKLTNSNKVQTPVAATFPDAAQNIVNDDIKELEALLVEYAESFFNKAEYEPSSELVNALQKNLTTADGFTLIAEQHKKRPIRHASANPHHHHHHNHLHHHRNLLFEGIKRKADGDQSVNIPRAVESGRLLFFTGLKKALWPIFMGLQVLKSLLFALFLPTLIGSFGKLLGKGIVSGSAPLFIRPPDTPQELDFRDNAINFDDEKFAMVDENNKEDGYAYNQAAASQTHYTYNAADINRIEQQNKMPDTYLSALQTIGSASFKNSGSLSGSLSGGGLGGGAGLGAPLRTKPIAPANTNTFQTFQKVPASSLLLSNYDPFYSPLLSRLDSVFAQLKLNSDNENCREKLICLMYANPAKYAPYSNLVSAQLSRELNELRKPTSDNPDILRFFKYMRAAKDGQDGVDCEKSFDQCTEFKDFENPAMVSTYHDINKLVQARKLA